MPIPFARCHLASLERIELAFFVGLTAVESVSKQNGVRYCKKSVSAFFGDP